MSSLTVDPKSLAFSSGRPPRPEAVGQLLERGDLRSYENGTLGMSGPALWLFRYFERKFLELAFKYGASERQYPTLMPISVMERTDYFKSFPHHATFALTLDRDSASLRQFVDAVKGGERVEAAATPRVRSAGAVLSGAVCYHCYAELQDRPITGEPMVLTTQGRCFRYEHGEFAPLRRQWEFTMREIVLLGPEAPIASVREKLLLEVVDFAKAHGLSGRIDVASDPFFGAVEGRARTLLQRAQSLKYELLVDVTGQKGGDLAIASFNLHGDSFSRTFGLTLPDGQQASTGCIAFGLERWVAAFVAHHGVDPAAWREFIPAGERMP
ncbi:MAG TPA: aminoacyl--tRNA ligase-related protein [Archangium sp.]|jgi:seryl-tRNA synthetase|uniref:aminoacyl--tRNA ligase-related protein n=1 Tax=Archangium sp. TaxID=1872627 RepID=UPI002ED82B24